MKITYLLGAGASALSLPTINKFTDALVDFQKEIVPEMESNVSQENQFYKDKGNTISQYAKSINDDLEKLIKASLRHQSIDTYAKKLTIQDEHRKLNNLKALLTMFFTYRQFKKLPDKRYDSFIASLINTGTKQFPKSIKILTWNYDIQFELSLCQFLDIEKLERAQEILSVYPPNVLDESIDKFAIFKLNGSAINLDNEGNYENPFKGHLQMAQNNTRLTEELFGYFYNSIHAGNTQTTGIKYSWEKDDKTIEVAKINTEDTNVLVVIGYSFPFFNRTVDQSIIRNMSQLHKVYIQADNEKNVNAIKQNFKSIGSNAEVETINEADQFFLPPELTL